MLKFESLYPRDFQAHFYFENNYYIRIVLLAIFYILFHFHTIVQTLTKQIAYI